MNVSLQCLHCEHSYSLLLDLDGLLSVSVKESYSHLEVPCGSVVGCRFESQMRWIFFFI
jgi:hypothetical protein